MPQHIIWRTKKSLPVMVGIFRGLLRCFYLVEFLHEARKLTGSGVFFDYTFLGGFAQLLLCETKCLCNVGFACENGFISFFQDFFVGRANDLITDRALFGLAECLLGIGFNWHKCFLQSIVRAISCL